MKRIKIAQIGTSAYSHGNDIFHTLKKLDDCFEIVGFCLPEKEREKFPEKMKEFEGYPELSLEGILSNPEIEAVAVETEEIYLTKYATMAAKAGKHIHCEKPGSQDPEAFERLIRLAENTEKVLHFGYMYRYNPFVSELIQRVKNGELGDIISVEAQMNIFHSKEFRQWYDTFEGGVTFFLGCHLIDLILLIHGMPEDVIPLNCSTGKEGVHTKDFGMAVFKYPNGVSFAKVNTTEVNGFSRRQLVVSGTKGTVEIKPLEEGVPEFLFGMKTYRKECSLLPIRDNGVTVSSDVFSRYDSMMTAFADYVRGEKENPYTLEYEWALYKTILKACGK